MSRHRFFTDADGNGLYYLGSLVYSVQNGAFSLESAAFDGGRFIATSSGVETRYYIADHLGSVRVIVDDNGEVIERNDFYPFGLRWDNAAAPIADNRYRYNAKEEQAFLSVPYIDYGARMYDPKYNIRWNSVDPLAEKYLYLSPFAFCGNNPIIMIDYTGKDHSIIINNRNKTITIQQFYYTEGYAYDSAKQAADFWNKQTGYTYTDTDGNIYDIKFDISVMTAHDPVDAAKKGLGNSYQLSNISQTKPNIFVNGATKYDKFITVDNSRIFSNTGAHEMGHALGMDHASEGIMTPTSNDENRSRPIPQENIDQMIEHATEVIIINTWFEALKNFFK